MSPVQRRRCLLGAGLLGSLLLAVGGYGVGAPPDRLDVPLALPLCVAGVLLLVGSWWQLREATSRTVLLAAGLWSLPLLVAAPMFSRDLYAYAGQAHVVLSGLDPYVDGPSAAPGPLADEVDDVWFDTPSPYGPVFLRLAAGVVAVTGERPLLAAFGLRLLAVLGLCLLAWGLVRLAPSYGVPAGRALWLGVANPLVLLHGVAGGHNDLLMLGLLVAGLSLAPVSTAAAAAVITTGALVKAPAAVGLLFLPLLVAEPRLRAAAKTAAAAALTALVVTAVSGLGWGWLGTLDAGQARRSLFSVTTGLGTLTGHEELVQTAGLLLAAVLAGALLVRARATTAIAALGTALLIGVTLSPIVHPWYLLWGICVLAACTHRRAALGLAAGCAVACLLILPTGRHLIRPPLYGVPLLLVAACAATVWWRGERTAMGRTGAAATRTSTAADRIMG